MTKLFFIYGPPGVGKLTVSKELSKLNNAKIFHNHLSIDFVSSMFQRDHEKFGELIDKYRLDLLKEAVSADVDNIIMTSVYIKNLDDPFIKNIINILNEKNGEVCFVRLICNIEKLKDRVQDESRKSFGKLTDKKILEEFVSTSDVTSEIPFVKSLTIDNTNIHPSDVAKMIMNHYK